MKAFHRLRVIDRYEQTEQGARLRDRFASDLALQVSKLAAKLAAIIAQNLDLL